MLGDALGIDADGVDAGDQDAAEGPHHPVLEDFTPRLVKDVIVEGAQVAGALKSHQVIGAQPFDDAFVVGQGE